MHQEYDVDCACMNVYVVNIIIWKVLGLTNTFLSLISTYCSPIKGILLDALSNTSCNATYILVIDTYIKRGKYMEHLIQYYLDS